MKTWVQRLQKNYSSLAEWEGYCETYGLLGRLGCNFTTAKAAWDFNPMIGGSVNPADFGIVKLDDFTRGYIECALWSSNDNSDDSGGEPLDKNYSISDIAPATLAQMVQDCCQFQDDNSEVLAKAEYPRNDSTDMAHAGHDFWLTRNGNGAGFWDGDLAEEIGDALTQASKQFKPVDLYVGDDGLIYN